MNRTSETKKGQIKSVKTSFLQRDERYDIEVLEDLVLFSVFHKDVKKNGLALSIDFAIEVALTILKGMNRDLLLRTLISLQDFYPGEFVGPEDHSKLDEDYGAIENSAIAGIGNVEVEGIPLEDLAIPEEGQAHVRAILDVIYDLAEVPVEELQDNLEKGIAHLFSVGAVTLESAAEVVSWECKTSTPGHDKPTPAAPGLEGGSVVPKHIREVLAPRGAGRTHEEEEQLHKNKQVIAWIEQANSTELLEFNRLFHAASAEKKPITE